MWNLGPFWPFCLFWPTQYPFGNLLSFWPMNIWNLDNIFKLCRKAFQGLVLHDIVMLLLTNHLVSFCVPLGSSGGSNTWPHCKWCSLWASWFMHSSSFSMTIVTSPGNLPTTSVPTPSSFLHSSHNFISRTTPKRLVIHQQIFVNQRYVGF